MAIEQPAWSGQDQLSATAQRREKAEKSWLILCLQMHFCPNGSFCLILNSVVKTGKKLHFALFHFMPFWSAGTTTSLPALQGSPKQIPAWERAQSRAAAQGCARGRGEWKKPHHLPCGKTFRFCFTAYQRSKVFSWNQSDRCKAGILVKNQSICDYFKSIIWINFIVSLFIRDCLRSFITENIFRSS